ncbi:CRISPR-associated protein Cas4 [Candidatus Ozemobacteraceae bacterium]|nr:CRISPR-associated protein Cas4 [Candidatus Ozemobacteraceae bacterium]
MSDELESILISSLNQFRFCRRRFALMMIEGIWEENEHTIIGALLHEQAHDPGYETEDGVKIIRALPLFSKKFGLSGKADVVELRNGLPYPIEYKKGRRKAWENDDVQLCAQALCLEEMFTVSISEGAIYHASSKKRRIVLLTDELRSQTMSCIEEARALLDSGIVPAAERMPKCDECSLLEHCLPGLTTRTGSQGSFQTQMRRLWEE